MKNIITYTIIAIATLFTCEVTGQPPEWIPSPASTNVMNVQGNADINGSPAVTGDYIAAFSQEGVLLGVVEIQATAANGFFQLPINGKDGSPINETLIGDLEYFTIQVWDASTNTFYEVGSPSLIGPFEGGNPPVTPDSLDIIEGGVTTTLANGFFDFTVNADNILPIELTDWGYAPRGCDRYDLHWTTASEINNDYFTIERSIDNPNRFEEIARLDGAGTTSDVHRYTYTDRVNLSGTHRLYYRLKQTDLDGKFSFSNILLVQHDCDEGSAVNFYPNPISNQVTLSMQSSDAVSVDIFDAQGRVILAIDNVDQLTNINTASWSDGTYYARVIDSAQKVTTIRLLKQD